MLQPLYWQQTT